MKILSEDEFKQLSDNELLKYERSLYMRSKPVFYETAINALININPFATPFRTTKVKEPYYSEYLKVQDFRLKKVIEKHEKSQSEMMIKKDKQKDLSEYGQLINKLQEQKVDFVIVQKVGKKKIYRIKNVELIHNGDGDTAYLLEIE